METGSGLYNEVSDVVAVINKRIFAVGVTVGK